MDINFYVMEDTEMSRFGILALTTMVLGAPPSDFEPVSYSLTFTSPPHTLHS